MHAWCCKVYHGLQLWTLLWKMLEGESPASVAASAHVIEEVPAEESAETAAKVSPLAADLAARAEKQRTMDSWWCTCKYMYTWIYMV